MLQVWELVHQSQPDSAKQEMRNHARGIHSTPGPKAKYMH